MGATNQDSVLLLGYELKHQYQVPVFHLAGKHGMRKQF
jgi:hypothetical protein